MQCEHLHAPLTRAHVIYGVELVAYDKQKHVNSVDFYTSQLSHTFQIHAARDTEFDFKRIGSSALRLARVEYKRAHALVYK